MENQENKKETANSQSVIQEEQEAGNEIDTSDWLTYRNKEYGFEVRYPADWEYNNRDGITFNSTDCVKNDFNECETYINFSTYKEKGKNYEDVFEWRKHDFKNNNINNPEESIVKINNINYKIIKFSSKNIDNALVDSYYFIDDIGNGWEITVKYYDKKESQIEFNTLKKILKTLKLLD